MRGNPRSPCRRALFALVAVLGSLTLTLGALEGFLRLVYPPVPVIRVSDPSPVAGASVPRNSAPLGKVETDDVAGLFYKVPGRGTRLRRNTDAFLPRYGYEGNVHIRSNSLGLRHAELPPKRPDEYRILVLGDSIVFAAELDEPATFVFLMEQALQGRGRTIRVLNAGIPGSSTRDQFYRFMELREAVGADLVLLGMYLNDAQDSSSFSVWSLRKPYNRSRLLSWVALRSQLVMKRIGREVTRGVRSSDREEEFWTPFRGGRKFPPVDEISYAPKTPDELDAIVYSARDDFGLGFDPASWDRIEPYVAAMRDAAAWNGAKLRPFLFPIRYQVEASFLEDHPQQYFRQMCERLGLASKDLLPSMRAWHKEGKKIFYDNCHLVRPGQVEVARELVRWLEDLGDVPAP